MAGAWTRQGSPSTPGVSCVRRRWLLLGWLLAGANPAFAALPPAPAPLALTAEEVETLASGDVVFRSEDTPQGALTIAVIDVNAPPRVVIDAVLDVGKRAEEVGSVKEVSIYDHRPTAAPEEMGVRFTLSIVGKQIVFHTRYLIDRDAAWCAYGLDPTQPNDIAYADGSYQAYKSGAGSRLVYRSTTQAGTSVPDWLRRWLVSGSLKDQLDGIKARAERTRAGSSL